MLPAIGFYELRAVLSMRLSVPLDSFLVPLPTRWRVPTLVQSVVLDIDVEVGEIEVRVILAVLSCLRPDLVRSFIAEPYAMLREVIRYLQLLKAPDPYATQRPKFDTAYVRVILILGVEVEDRFVGSVILVGGRRGMKLAVELAVRFLRVIQELLEDILKGAGQFVLSNELRYCGLGSFDVCYDAAAEPMERYGRALWRGLPVSRSDISAAAFLVERQHQDFVRRNALVAHEVGNFPNDDRGLSRSRSRHHEGHILVCGDSLGLFVR